MDASLQARAEELAQELADQVQTIEDLNGMLRAMTKATLERMLNTEMDVHLGRKGSSAAASAVSAESAGRPSVTSFGGDGKRSPNRRNGRSCKTVQGDLGKVTITTPRDRDGTFTPLVIGKHQRRVPGFDEKILALYAKGMTTRDIQELVQELYGVEVSPTLISEITADLDAEVKEWRTRRLDAVWPIVFLDGLVVRIRAESGHVREHTMYVAIGVNFAVKKEFLGL